MRTVVALAGVLALTGGTLAAVTVGNASAAEVSTLVTDAGRALRTNPAAVRSSGKDQFQVYSSKTDSAGRGVVRYTRTYSGLRVAGGDVAVRTTADGAHAGTSVGLAAPLNLSTDPAVTGSQARDTATAAFDGTVSETESPELFVDAVTGTGRLAWEVVVSGRQPDGQTPSRLHVVVDAQTGEVIRKHDDIHTVAGTGNSVYAGQVKVDTTQAADGTYSLVDPERGGARTCDMNNSFSGCTDLTDADNTWGTGKPADRQSAAVDAHFGAAATYDYFKNVHGRNGVFGDGRGVTSRVHYGDGFVNAFWDGTQMTYGDGAGNAKPLVSLDVAAHEMSHGVTSSVVPGGLVYSGESGGLNEATSDIFGSMVEFSANSAGDPGDYDIGEKIDVNGDGKPVRYMYDPALDGRSASCWTETASGLNVHLSSGVANHFFFNLAEGTGQTAYGNSPVCGSAPAVTGIGREKAARIWFRALDTYFVTNTGLVDTADAGNSARAYTLAAAADLYGRCGTEYQAVRAAWTAVAIAGTDAC